MKRALAPLFVALLLAVGLMPGTGVGAQEGSPAAGTPTTVAETPTADDGTPTADDDDDDTGGNAGGNTSGGSQTGTTSGTGTSTQALPNTGAGTEQGAAGTDAWMIAVLLLVAAIGFAIPFRLRRNA